MLDVFSTCLNLDLFMLDMPFKKALLTARDLANNGKHKEALEHYTILYKKDPHDEEVQEAIQKLENKLAPPKTLKEKLEHLVKHYTSGELKEAISYGDLLIEDYPKDAIILTILGAANNDLGNLEKAAEKFTEICVLQPNNFEAHNNLGKVLVESEKHLDAIPYLKKAIKINPKSSQTHDILGVAFHYSKKFKKAIEQYKLAIRINKKNPDTYERIAEVFLEIGHYDNSITAMEQAVKIKPKIITNKYGANLIKKYLFYGQEVSNTGNIVKAIEIFYRVAAIDPHYLPALLYALNYSPNLTAEEICQGYKSFNEQFGLPIQTKWASFLQKKNISKRLKIGYVSPDFKNHPMNYILGPLLEKHDRKLFEVFAFAELVNEDNKTANYKKIVDHWIPTRELSDEELAKKIRSLGIDILIDCAGHTSGNRLGAFMYKPAPVSISWWVGYGYTSGVSAIDYFLTDSTLAPPGSEHLFAEKLWRIKGGNDLFRATTAMGEEGPLPALSNGFITFGTLSRTIRINEKVIKVWSEILKKVKNSKLIINSLNLKGNQEVITKLKKDFAKYGITENRLNFYFESPPWNTMRSIDIALDCFPHNSGTTIIEHLYMGNPVITLAGRPSVGLIGSYYLKTIGRPEWIAETKEQYIEKALLLASNIENLSDIRSSLRKEIRQSSMMNEELFMAKMESTYQEMWKKWCESEVEIPSTASLSADKPTKN